MRLALGDALRAERHVDVEAEPGEQLLDQGGDARVDGAAQDEELAVAEVVGAPRQRPGDRALVGVEVLVDRGADHDDDVLGGAHDGRVGGGDQPLVRDRPFQHRLRTGLGERHAAVADLPHRGRVDVVDRDIRAPAGEGDRQRQPDVAAPADNHHIACKGRVTVKCSHEPDLYLVGTGISSTTP